MFVRCRDRGFTLFEVLVYIGLFSFIMAGTLGATFQLIEGGVSTRSDVFLEQEANFIFRKIDWALNGEVSDVSLISDGFRVIKPGDDVDFVLDSGSLYIDIGSGDEILTSGAVTVSVLSAEVTPEVVGPPRVPPALEVSFEMNGREFATSTRYIR